MVCRHAAHLVGDGAASRLTLGAGCAVVVHLAPQASDLLLGRAGERPALLAPPLPRVLLPFEPPAVLGGEPRRRLDVAVEGLHAVAVGPGLPLEGGDELEGLLLQLVGVEVQLDDAVADRQVEEVGHHVDGAVGRHDRARLRYYRRAASRAHRQLEELHRVGVQVAEGELQQVPARRRSFEARIEAAVDPALNEPSVVFADQHDLAVRHHHLGPEAPPPAPPARHREQQHEGKEQ